MLLTLVKISYSISLYQQEEKLHKDQFRQVLKMVQLLLHPQEVLVHETTSLFSVLTVEMQPLMLYIKTSSSTIQHNQILALNPLLHFNKNANCNSKKTSGLQAKFQQVTKAKDLARLSKIKFFNKMELQRSNQTTTQQVSQLSEAS